MIYKYLILILLSIIFFDANAQQEQKVIAFVNRGSLDKKKNIEQFVYKKWNAGFIEFQILNEQITKDTLYCFYKDGEKFKWRTIRHKGVDAAIFNKYSTINNTINPVELASSISKFLNYYENNGYPFASIHLDSVNIDNTNVDATLIFDKGKQYIIDSITVRGSAKISKKYILNLLGIKDGDIYNESLIHEIDKKLKNNLFFKVSKPSMVVFTPTSSKIIVFLDKVQSSKFDGLVGFYPNETTGKLQLTGDLQLHLANSIAHAEVFDLRWKKLTGQSQELNTSLDYPYLFNTVFGISGGLNMLKQDTLYLNLDEKIGVFYLFNSLNHIKLFINRRSSTVITSNVDAAKALGISNYSTLLFGASGQHVSLDDVIVPTRGFVIDFEAMAGNKQITDKSLTGSVQTKKQILAGFKYSKYFRLSKRFVYKINSQIQTTIDNNIYANELYRIGGMKTLRGFDEQSIYASDYALLSNELRLLMDKTSYLFSFVDAGWYENRAVSNTTLVHDTPMGIGAGISFETKVGIFSISYALGKQFGNPIDMKNGKIHFGLNTVF